MPSNDTPNGNRWKQTWDLFHTALERPAEARQSLVEAATQNDASLRSEVLNLLRAHEAANRAPLTLPTALLVEVDFDESFDPQPGERIGPFILSDIVGRGGMGVVYRAEQHEPVRRTVAIKLLQLGLATREVMARFDAERQALAMMSHSHIAKVYDAGATESGRSYFVMEYVDGPVLTDYCDGNCLSLTARIRVFLDVCAGVEHAHQKGVIHRDIKPSNILVASENARPVVKIIDFGIAKAIDVRGEDETQMTRVGSLIGTPGYMSPEQEGVLSTDVDTRADVYSLGVLLYRLLVGALPFADTQANAAAAPSHSPSLAPEPRRPAALLSALSAEQLSALSRNRDTSVSTLRKDLKSDVLWIAIKAMEKDRERRYASVADFARDIRRYLDGLPVDARAPTWIYRAGKFMRRHAFGVAAGATLAILLIAFAASMAVQSQRLQHALNTTEMERSRAEQVTDFMLQLFASSNPNESEGNGATARSMLDGGVMQLKDSLADQPELRARLLATMAEAYRVLGGDDNTKKAIEQLELALSDLQSLSLPNNNSVASVFNSLASVYHDTGDLENAETYYFRAAQLFRSMRPDADADLANVLAGIADIKRDKGVLAEAEVFALESLEIKQRVFGEKSYEAARLGQRVAYLQHLQSRTGEALPMLKEAVAIIRTEKGATHPYTANALNYLATLQASNGDVLGAQASLREAADIYRVSHGEDHLYLATTLSNLANAYRIAKQYDLAVTTGKEAVQIGIATYGVDHPSVGAYRLNLGNSLREQGRYQEAAPELIDGLRQDRIYLDAGSVYFVSTFDRLADVHQGLGQLDKADNLLRELLALLVERQGKSDSDTGFVHHRLAMNLLKQGRLSDAELHSREALKILRAAGPSATRRLAQSLHGLGRIAWRHADFSEANSLFQEALQTLEDSEDGRLTRTRIEIDRAIYHYANASDIADVERLKTLRRDLASELPDGHPEVAWLDSSMGRLICRHARTAEGSAAVAAAKASLGRAIGQDNWQLARVDLAQAECLRQQGKELESTRLVQRSLDILRTALGAGHFEVIDLEESLASG